MPAVLSDSYGTSEANIAVIGEGPVEEWNALAGGGFERAAFDLPALLYDTDLLHLYDVLIAEELSDLWQRYSSDRVAFLAYLKDDVGLSKLSDRQLFANALARAKRHGLYTSNAEPSRS